MSKRLIVTNTFYQLASRAISALTSATITILVARQLSVVDFGQFIKMVNYVTIFMMPIDFGLNAIVVRTITYQTKHTSSQLSLLTSFRLALASMLILISIVIATFLPSSGTQGFTPLVKLGIYILSFQLFAFAIIRSLNALFQKLLQYQFTLIAETITSIVVLFSLYLTLAHTRSIITLTWGYAVGGSLAALSLYLITRLKKVSLTLSFNYLKWRQLFLSSLPLGLTLIINTLIARFDILMLSLTRPTPEVGFYGLAKRVFELVLVFPVFFTNSLYPLLLKRPHKRPLVTKSLFALLTIALLSFLILYPAAPLFAWIKSDFTASINLFRILLFSLPIFFTTALLMWTLISLKKERLLPKIYLFALLFNLVSNSITIPVFGASAAAFNVIITEAIALAGLTYFVLKSLRSKKAKTYV